MADTPSPRRWWLLVLVPLIGLVASTISQQVWLARNVPVELLEPAPDPDFARDLGCQVVQLCGTPHQSLTLKVTTSVTVEPIEGAPPGWLDCARRQVANYPGIGDIPINPCK